MLGNSDLKDEQNALYTLTEPFEGASRWYVARDLGQSFGRTGVLDAPRGDPKVFEETPFIKGMAGQYVRFDYRGRHGVLLDRMTAADVRWICERLQTLTDKQWDDAFRAGGYAPEVAEPVHPPFQTEDRRRAGTRTMNATISTGAAARRWP